MRFGSDPDALLLVETSSIPGFQLNVILIILTISVSHTETVSIRCIKSMVDDDDDESLQPVFDQLKTIWDSMRINGKKAKSADMDIDGILGAVARMKYADKEKGEVLIDNHVRQEGNYLVVGDRWRMELPYGVRYRFKTRSEDLRYDELNIYLDSRCVGFCYLGETVKEQEEAF